MFPQILDAPDPIRVAMDVPPLKIPHGPTRLDHRLRRGNNASDPFGLLHPHFQDATREIVAVPFPKPVERKAFSEEEKKGFHAVRPGFISLAGLKNQPHFVYHP